MTSINIGGKILSVGGKAIPTGSGSGPGGTTTPPASGGTLARYDFAGAAGNPTEALSLQGGAVQASYQLTGNGTLFVDDKPGYAILTGLGTVTNGTITMTFANPNPRTDAVAYIYFGQGYRFGQWLYGDFSRNGNGIWGSSSRPTPKSNIAVGINGDVVTLMIDGKAVYQTTVAAGTAVGPVGIGGWNTGYNIPGYVDSLTVDPTPFVAPAQATPTIAAYAISSGAPGSTPGFTGTPAFLVSAPGMFGYGDPIITVGGADAALFRMGDYDKGVNGRGDVRGTITAGNKALSATLQDPVLGTITSTTATIPVAAGSRLPDSAITCTPIANLTNGFRSSPGTRSVFAQLAVSGMSGTLHWDLIPYGVDGASGTRGCIDIDQTGAVAINNAQEDGVSQLYCLRAPAETFGVRVTNGTDYAQAWVAVPVASAIGPTYDIGVGQTYSSFKQAAISLTGLSASAQLAAAGIVFAVRYNADRRFYYGAFNDGSNEAGYDASRALFNGPIIPHAFKGVPDPTTGKMPIAGGAAGYFGKGAFGGIRNRDFTVSGFEIENMFDPDGGQSNLAGVRLEGQGNVNLSQLHIHNCDNAILAHSVGKVVERNIFIEMCGTGQYARTHSQYLAEQEIDLQYIRATKPNSGHSFKSRSTKGKIQDFTFGDLLIGRGSFVADMPCGGDYQFYRGQFIKGPMGQNSPIVAHSEETKAGGREVIRNPGNRLYFEDCDFINFYPDDLWNGGAVGVAVTGNGFVGIPYDIDTGLPPNVTFVRCRVFNIPPDRFLQYGGQPWSTTQYPPGVTAMAEPPPCDMRSTLTNQVTGNPLVLNGAAPWSTPFGAPSNVGPNISFNGLIDFGVHEIRISRSTAVGASIAQAKAWGVPYYPTTDHRYDPFSSGATYAKIAGGGAIASFSGTPYFDVSASGALTVKAALTNAPTLLHVFMKVTDSTGAIVQEAMVAILLSETPSRTDNVSAILVQPTRMLNSESKG